MALLPQEPKQQRALIVIVAAVALAFVVYQYVYTPRMEEVEATRERVEALELSNQRASVLAARGGGNIEEQLALYQRHVMRLEELIPASDEVASLIRTISAEARRLGVEIAFLGPEPTQAGQFYDRQVYAVRAIGSYHDLARFLTAIASLPRIITPMDVEMTRFDDPQNVYDNLEAPVLATFRMETYVVPADGGTGAPADSLEAPDPEAP
jgi:type IV pilus assembly protein PilO